MARPNYNAVKRQKELKRKAKRDAKLARKHARKAEQEAAGASGEAPSPGDAAVTSAAASAEHIPGPADRTSSGSPDSHA